MKEKIVLNGLVAVTARFDEKYMSTPNAIYSILRNLALEFVNVIEIVSTYSEISVVVFEEDMEKTFAVLSKSLQK